MRILHISPSFYPAWAYGGIPRCAYELCRSMSYQGEQVTVWTTDVFDGERRLPEQETTVDGIVVRRFWNLSNHLAYERQLYLPLGIWGAAERDLDEFDIVHIHSHRHLIEAVVARAAHRRGLPYVFTGNGTVPAIERYVRIKKILDRLGARDILRRAAACVAVSQAEVSHYTNAGVDPRRVRIVPNGIRLDEFDYRPPKGTFRRVHGLGERPLLVFVGKITPRKGVDVLLRALALLPHEVMLVVAGNFMMPKSQLVDLAAQLGVQDRVRFVGLLLGDDRNAAYVDADVVAYPSTDEIFGLVAAEALMCDTPVVVCDDSGCGELVRDAKGGLLVPYGDERALANALRMMLGDPRRRAECAIAGRQFVEQNLNWDSIAEKTRALYADVLSGALTADAPPSSGR